MRHNCRMKSYKRTDHCKKYRKRRQNIPGTHQPRHRHVDAESVCHSDIGEEQEYADLKTQRDSDYTKLKDTRAEVAELQKIRRCVDIALRADQPEQTQSRTKRQEQER